MYVLLYLVIGILTFTLICVLERNIQGFSLETKGNEGAVLFVSIIMWPLVWLVIIAALGGAYLSAPRKLNVKDLSSQDWDELKAWKKANPGYTTSELMSWLAGWNAAIKSKR